MVWRSFRDNEATREQGKEMKQRENRKAGGLIMMLRRFLVQTKGAMAVEFAMIFPLMLTIYFGTVEMSHALAASRKVTLLTSTVGDIVAQFATIGPNALAGIYDAADEIMRPFETDGAGQLRINVFSIAVDPADNWTHSPNGACPQGTPAVPAALLASGGSVIVAQVCYIHNSILSQFFTSDPTFSDVFYLRPRQVDVIEWDPAE